MYLVFDVVEFGMTCEMVVVVVNSGVLLLDVLSTWVTDANIHYF